MWIARSSARLTGADREEGAASVEYALLASLIAAVIVAVVRILGQNVQPGFETVSTQIP
ncbi:MAG: Flp family type IVb pilin [Acidobacteria bacterium]|nr:Flp family type IVb pilin [Acidobacteriota bacterium]